jgi:hypothetical protein
VRKGAERKVINMHLLKAHKARCKSDVKIDGKRNRKRRKKGGKRREKARKGPERKMGNKHLLEHTRLHT